MQEEVIRTEFEKWAKEALPSASFERSNGVDPYYNTLVQMMWEGWRAAERHYRAAMPTDERKAFENEFGTRLSAQDEKEWDANLDGWLARTAAKAEPLTFMQGYIYHIYRQQDAKIICPACAHTKIEHSFSPSLACNNYQGPNDPWHSPTVESEELCTGCSNGLSHCTCSEVTSEEKK